MNCLSGLSDKQKKKILSTKLPINFTFGDLNTEVFLKWYYLTFNYLPANLVNKKITIKNGLIFLDKTKTGLKPSKIFNNYIPFSLTKTNCSWEILYGNDILKGYDSTKSSVKSCMTFNSKSKKILTEELNFYCKNKNIQLLVVKENDKIVARTLLWKSGKRTYFDRIYFHNPLWQYYIKMICEINNFNNSNDDDIYVKLNYIPTISFSYNKKRHRLIDTSKLPFLDTLTYYDKKSKKLTNESDYHTIDLTEENNLCDYIKDFSL